MSCIGSRRRSAPQLALLLVLGALPATAWAQSIDCTALRAQIDTARGVDSPGQYDIALRQQRDEILRTRAYADQTGCGDGIFDDPDSQQCRALARRVGALEVGLQRLQDQASRGDPAADERRRALQDTYDGACRVADAEPPTMMLPVDPDSASRPAASVDRSPVVLCVRRCDGAYYPLASNVPSDSLGDMDRVCQAQCPASPSSAYAGRDAEDPSAALATDGSRYADLTAAFQFRKGSSPACACRAPHQSWAEALAGAEALLEPHKGDITVTAALSASMAQPIVPAKAAPSKAAPAKAMPATPRKAPRKAPAPPVVSPEAPPPAEAAGDLTREFRRSVPTL